jgi:hypothetical protein
MDSKGQDFMIAQDYLSIRVSLEERLSVIGSNNGTYNFPLKLPVLEAANQFI